MGNSPSNGAGKLYTVLALDGHWRQTLSLTRSLGRKGIRVIVGEASSVALAKFSKYCSSAIRYPDPEKCPSKFIQFLTNYARDENIDLVVAGSEFTAELLALHRDEFPQATSIPLPTAENLLRGIDKATAVEQALAVGIPCPRTFFAENESELRSIRNQLPYPVLLRPRRSTGSLGIVKVDCADDLMSAYKSVHDRFPNPMIQEKIEYSERLAVSVVMNPGSSVKGQFVGTSLQFLPADGGLTIYAKGIHDDYVRQLAVRLLHSLNWCGPAEVEFLRDAADGQPKFVEINARFGGSVELAVFSGMDLPYHLFRSSVLRDFTPHVDYRSELYSRWMVPGEFLSLLFNPNRLTTLRRLLEGSREDTTFQVFSKEDPLPALGILIASAIGVFFHREIRALFKQLFTRIFSLLSRLFSDNGSRSERAINKPN